LCTRPRGSRLRTKAAGLSVESDQAIRRAVPNPTSGAPMESALKDLGVTFLVGAIAILGIEFVLHYLLNIDLTGFFRGRLGLGSSSFSPGRVAGGSCDGPPEERRHRREPADEGRANLSATVFVMLAFAVGSWWKTSPTSSWIVEGCR
jgi:hypothetical protein